MQVELRYTEGCPAAQPLRETTESVLDDLAPYEHIVFMKTSAAEGSAAAIFPGSPVLRVDGREVGSEESYTTGLGLPDPKVPQEPEIRAAVSQAALRAPVRLPLRHRRLVIVAALLILLGALLGQLLTWGVVITLAGLGILAVAFASNGRSRGPQPYMWAAGSAALAWLLATIVIWWEAFFGGPAPQETLTDALFWVGLAAAAIAALSITIATVLRHQLRRWLRSRAYQP